MPNARPLAQYEAKRDFARTPEPAGRTAPAPAGAPRFVVQEHHARALHWDFRLERDGVLVSWAVPKGIPLDPRRNHRAIRVEDHPLEYGSFEGDIPEGEYGAGHVSIWDSGTYETEKFRDDEVMVVLHGQRLQGRYVLFAADAARPRGATAGPARNWLIHRMEPAADPARQAMPRTPEPMLATPGALPRDDAAYAYEVKWDGVRALCFVEGGRARLVSRNGLDLSAQFPEVREIGAALGATEAILDGEIVALDGEGRPSFEHLQQRLGLARERDVRRRREQFPVTYMLFDILFLDGRPLEGLPYTERRRLLEGLALSGPAWSTPAYHAGEGAAMLAATRERGLEGLVAKRLASSYQPGRRSPDWLKIKHSRGQEFVVGGWTAGEGARGASIGALLLGYYDTGNSGVLRFAGKVGSGFSDSTLALLAKRLAALDRASSPFGAGAVPAGAHFVEPELVAEVEYAGWTSSGHLRHPVFRGLRADKPAREVTREGAAPVESGTAVAIEGRTLNLTNPAKMLYPAAGFTKAEVIDYYVRIAPALIPHLRGRALTLKRYPNGVDDEFFFEKACPAHRPEWVRTAPIWSPSSKREIPYCLCDDVPTLAWLANLAALELHPSLALASDRETPLCAVFDLDPGDGAGMVQCCQVAIALRERFSALGLEAFAKTSGSKGLQLYLPLNSAATFLETSAFARSTAAELEREMPRMVVSNMRKELRRGKVLIDWSQNNEHKTTVAVYSLRARERPTVSTPVTWKEVEAGTSGEPLSFEAAEVLDRVARLGDLFGPVLTLVQHLPPTDMP